MVKGVFLLQYQKDVVSRHFQYKPKCYEMQSLNKSASDACGTGAHSRVPYSVIMWNSDRRAGCVRVHINCLPCFRLLLECCLSAFCAVTVLCLSNCKNFIQICILSLSCLLK